MLKNWRHLLICLFLPVLLGAAPERENKAHATTCSLQGEARKELDRLLQTYVEGQGNDYEKIAKEIAVVGPDALPCLLPLYADESLWRVCEFTLLPKFWAQRLMRRRPN